MDRISLQPKEEIFILNSTILGVLKRFQTRTNAYVVGGYLRDFLIGKEPSDVDVAIEISMSEAKKLFPQINGTEKGLEFGVGRFQKNGVSFEISTYEPGSFISSLPKRDFVINTLFHDGEQLYDLYGAKEDLKNRVLRPQDDPVEHLLSTPATFLRAIRLCAELDLETTPFYLKVLKEQSYLFFDEIHEYRKQTEAYKIILSKNPVIAFIYLKEIGILKSEILTPASFSFISSDPAFRLAYLGFLLGNEIVNEFFEKFPISQKIQEKSNVLYQYFFKDEIENKKHLSEFILIKRYQYQNDKEKIKEILLRLNR